MYEHGMVLREVADTLQIPMGTAASHLARGKAAVAAYVELVPELEKSAKKELGNSKSAKIEIETVIAEVVDNNE
jgi:DNA-directed RNA polymerase specialized sigma24 family protein